jgi:glycogen operon protein
MNMYWEALPFELPRLPDGTRWRVFANTSMPSPEDVFEPGSEPELVDQAGCLVGGRSVLILVGRPAGQESCVQPAAKPGQSTWSVTATDAKRR